MPAKLVVAARRFFRNGATTYNKGDIVSLVTDGGVFGTKEVPPDFVRVEISDATTAEAEHYLFQWQVDFDHTLVSQNGNGWRYRVEVSPEFVDVGSRARKVIRQSMLDHMGSAAPGSPWEGCSVVSFTQEQIVVDIPKDGVYQTANALTNAQYLAALKADFSDIYREAYETRRYRFAEADVDAALLLPNGHVTITKAQAVNKLIDKLTE